MLKHWGWMALFTIILLAVGTYEILAGGTLAGAGYVAAGTGAGLATWGQRRSAGSETKDPLSIAGTAFMGVGILLVGIHLLA